MTHYAWYRYIKCLFGARSLIKVTPAGGKVYVLIKGRDIQDVVDKLLKDGYKEEFQWA